MKALLDLRQLIEIVDVNLRVLRDVQKTFDSPFFMPSQINLPPKAVPASSQEISQFIFGIKDAEQELDVTGLMNMIGRARISLYITQAQIELSVRQDRSPGLAEAIVDDERTLHALFEQAAEKKRLLLRDNKMSDAQESVANDLLGKLNQEMADVDVPTQVLQAMAPPQLLQTIFQLRLLYAESTVSAVKYECSKIHMAHQRIGGIVKMIETDILPDSHGARDLMEKDRHYARNALQTCGRQMDNVENHLQNVYRMGRGIPVHPDFEIVRYVPAPLRVIGLK